MVRLDLLVLTYILFIVLWLVSTFSRTKRPRFSPLGLTLVVPLWTSPVIVKLVAVSDSDVVILIVRFPSLVKAGVRRLEHL